MDADRAREFLRTNHRAVMCTLRADGSPTMTPITVTVDPQGRVVVSSRSTAYKVRHIRRTGEATILLLNDGFFGEWGQVSGPVEIVELPEAMEGLVDYYRSASGEHPDWDDYRAAMVRDQRVLLRLTIEQAGPTVEG